jgi:hypothetical protein
MIAVRSDTTAVLAPAELGEEPATHFLVVYSADRAIVFAIDWAICEDTLGRLLDREERGVLSPAQQARLASLKALIAQHRPTLERLLAES